MSEIKVNSIKGVGASTAAITVNNTDGTCTANITNRTNRNLVVNGACLISQRATSSTTSGYSTVDRFKTVHSGTDEAPTYAQVDVASGTTPYTSGFRKALKITNGNQTSGAGAADFISYAYRIEAQDIANSGWNYVSSSSYITLSFWIKSSVAQDFKGYIRSHDGTSQAYAFATGSLSADTWTKITKTIPGNSNLTFDNNNDVGFELVLGGFWGTDYTNNSVTENAWAAYASGTRMKDNTSTWYTTNDSTIELTGLQLEVNSSGVATDFEHRSIAVEKRLSMRYYQKYLNPRLRGVRGGNNTDCHRMGMTLLVEMRSDPTLSWTGTQNVYDGDDLAAITAIGTGYPDPLSVEFEATISGTLGTGTGSAIVAYTGGHEGTLMLDAEL